MAPQRIVMVSCNPATAARDLKYLSQHGYAVQAVQPVDMFPRTKHVECAALLCREKILKVNRTEALHPHRHVK